MHTQAHLDALHAVVPAAQEGLRRYGVPASVTLAQWTLESGWGTTALARECRNYFGVKHTHNAAVEPYMEFKTTEYVHGKPVVEICEFVKYGTDAEAFEAHARLLALSSRYTSAMRDRSDVPEFCSQLQICGYSTNPHYATDLLTIIRQLNLTQYDKLPPDAAVAAIQEAA